jgi:hypothetical protein
VCGARSVARPVRACSWEIEKMMFLEWVKVCYSCADLEVVLIGSHASPVDRVRC